MQILSCHRFPKSPFTICPHEGGNFKASNVEEHLKSCTFHSRFHRIRLDERLVGREKYLFSNNVFMGPKFREHRHY